ncbi:hypothetical protein M0R45_003038 [Rubus argutus]|uniref:Uncharacterized protein n=1 Tax=Rubus argutus TaxID=59490 RepID=A0AAW1YF48_RUBAR
MANGSNRRQRRQFSSSPPISGMGPSRTAFDSPSTTGFTKHRRLHPAPPTEPELDAHHTHLPTASPTTPFSPLTEFGNRSKSIAPSPLDSSIAKSS